jgi:hypothetical protein
MAVKKKPQQQEEDKETSGAPLTCAFGEPWIGPHPLCQAQLTRDCAAFAAAVTRGEYDARGYTPNERKALTRKQATNGTCLSRRF